MGQYYGSETVDSISCGNGAGMYQFFVDEQQVQQDQIVITGQDVNHIGEAVLTSVAARNFSAAAKLSREQTRASNQETYMEIVNSQDVSEEVRQNAMDSLMKLTDNAEKELAAETLLEAKGYENSVVSINDTSVDVVICLNELTEVQRAQIEDIVKRKAEVETDRIVITTLQQ